MTEDLANQMKQTTAYCFYLDLNKFIDVALANTVENQCTGTFFYDKSWLWISYRAW